jgi:hypothetical protein
MKLTAPNGKRITHSVDRMTVYHHISDVWPNDGGTFGYDVDDYEDDTNSIEPVTDKRGSPIFVDETGVEWPQDKITLTK